MPAIITGVGIGRRCGRKGEISNSLLQRVDADFYQFKGRPYLLNRGDVDMVVLPPELIPELNTLSQNVINSRRSHSTTLLGHLNGINVVLETSFHVKILLNKVTPSLPYFFKSAASRIQETLGYEFPQSTTMWTAVKPLDRAALCISRAITLMIFGAPTCDNPELIRAFVDHAENVFSVAFVMRLVPWFLQRSLVWLNPFTWHLRKTWEILKGFVTPRVEHSLLEKQRGLPPGADLISSMIHSAKDSKEADPERIAGIIASTAAGAIHSSAALVISVIAHLAAHPLFLEEIREEIRMKNEELGGQWNINVFQDLLKLDSAMKETTRIAPSTRIVYMRAILENHTLSTGLELKKGQYLCVSGANRAMDPTLFPNPEEYDALRAFKDLDGHRTRPFNNSHAEDFRWGSGRWACPGRYIATLLTKIIIVKLVNEYDFGFPTGSPPQTTSLHEFNFMLPNTEFLMRRREKSLYIEF
ncbi:hypothetical protein G7Y89_g14301 [Cudoniella acicularis]|uniref:Cytochrome P450 n=1 Tax=Cudoniella acicularis TaxID=354080 RepID=A0A8H4VWB1_9HELO|nr:hypothetical protein G7Y89_g14301 [Cudoniella acicularis]